MTQQKVLTGKLKALAERGSKGLLWAFVEDGNKGLNGIHILEKGDFLQVFNNVVERKSLYVGKIDLDFEHRLNPETGLQMVRNKTEGGDRMAVEGLPKDHDPENWTRMFLAEKPAQLILNHSANTNDLKGNDHGFQKRHKGNRSDI